MIGTFLNLFSLAEVTICITDRTRVTETETLCNIHIRSHEVTPPNIESDPKQICSEDQWNTDGRWWRKAAIARGNELTLYGTQCPKAVVLILWRLSALCHFKTTRFTHSIGCFFDHWLYSTVPRWDRGVFGLGRLRNSKSRLTINFSTYYPPGS